MKAFTVLLLCNMLAGCALCERHQVTCDLVVMGVVGVALGGPLQNIGGPRNHASGGGGAGCTANTTAPTAPGGGTLFSCK